ncbi:MAG: 3'-5' exonuclease [Bacillota bacterium]|nr:3'-5' exonuclease [Bacillota bacterium]
MNYIVLDLEFNQAFPFKSGKKAEPNPECPFEIIQIGAVKLNDAFETMGTFDAMIRPQLYPRLHPFVEKITGIHPEMLTGKPSFREVYASFLQFIGKEPAILCTWGGDDVKSLYRNILFHNLDAGAMTNQFLNVQPFAAQYLNHEPGKAIGLKNAVEALGIPKGETFHNALNDAVYTAEIFRITHPAEIHAETFNPLSMLAKKPKKLRTNMKSLLMYVEERLERSLSEEEKGLVKMAYMLGRNHTFDATPAVRKKTKDEK